MNATGKSETGACGQLLGEFEAHTYAQWKAAAEDLLKGRSFEKTLQTPTYEGITLQPIYMRGDLEGLEHLGTVPGAGNRARGGAASGYLGTGWRVSQELSAPTPAALNRIVLNGLENGQDELNLWMDQPSREGFDADASQVESVGVCGVSLSDVEDLNGILKGVELSYISTYLRAGISGAAAYALLVAVAQRRGEDLEKLRGAVCYDPVGWLAERGDSGSAMDVQFEQMAELVRYAAKHTPNVQVMQISGEPYHSAGASSVQEMGAVLATAVTVMNNLVERGIEPAAAVKRLRVVLAVGPNYFTEIAKFRAFRLVWNRLMEAYGVAEADRSVYIHARTGLFNKTLYDPYVNMLRTTTEAFSAVVGGCDGLHVGCFDEIIRESDDFARRVARNVHAILAEECDLRRVVDPAGGAYAVEVLTDQMAREAWKHFQEIEKRGGMLAALKEGYLQQAVEEVRKGRVKAVHQRRDVIVGSNSYPNATETLLKAPLVNYQAIKAERVATLQARKAGRDAAALEASLERVRGERGEGRIAALVNAAAAGATIGEMMEALRTLGGASTLVKPFTLQRLAEDYERLRLAADNLRSAGVEALVHQLNIGPSRGYRLRADWTSAFFQVAGLRVLNDDDYAGVDDALAALKASGAKAAILTSDDVTYAEQGVALAERIKAEVPGLKLLLAGAPGEQEAALRAAGIDDFVHVRVNNFEVNQALLSEMGAVL